MDRVLVTGGAGFLGSHLCERLVASGASVICVDDFSTGKRENLAGLEGHPHFRVVQHDVTRPLDEELRVDQIYNLACPASPVRYQADPVQTTLTSVLGALHVLQLADRCGARVLQASTSEVYGDPDQHPQSEAYLGRVNPTGPRACYDEGKRCAESLFFDMHRTRGVVVKVARIFNTYGPRMSPDDGRVVSSFVRQALDGQPMTVFGDGNQTRSFCFVDDLVDGLVRLMASSEEVTGPVNLGRPGEVTMLALAEQIAALTGSAGGVVHRPLPTDDPVRREPDIRRARVLLDWEPRTSLEEGLRRTIAWQRTAR